MKLNRHHIHARAADIGAADLETSGLSVTGRVVPEKTVLADAVANALAFHFSPCFISPRFIIPLLSCTLPGLVFAGPEGGQVVAGTATISNPDANTTLITQTTTRTAIDWQRFNIGSQEYVQFVQPSSSSVALNRVIGGNPSQILGNLSANGQVFLVNPNGVYFGQGATVDVGGLVASVRGISTDDFMSGNYVFSKALGAPDDVGVVNDGVITAKDGGYVVMMGDYVHNNGIISARMGTVALAAGNSITMDVKGNGLVSVVVEEATLSKLAGVNNAGQIMADGGRVMMTAKVANDLVDTAINNKGLIVANSIAERNGVIFLTAAGADIVNSGTLDASAKDGSNVDGGGVLVYSDKDVTNAAGAVIRATGDGSGDGGTVRVIAENLMDHQAGALIDVTSDTGSGGFVEVSGHGSLALRGEIDVGSGGELLIDPMTLSISNGNSSPSASNSDAYVGKGFIEGQLNSGVNITLVASNTILATGGSQGSATPTFTIASTNPAGSLSIKIGTLAVGGSLAGSGTAFTCAVDGFCIGGGSLAFVPGANGSINLSTVTFNLAGGLSVAGGTTAGNIGLGSVNAGNVTINGGGSINLINVNATNQISVSGSVINAGTISSSLGSVSLNGGVVNVTNVSALNQASISGGSINANVISAGNVLVNASGSVNVGGGGISANTLASFVGSTVSVGAVSAGRKVLINATNSITAGNISVNASTGEFAEIALTAGGNITQTSGAIYSASGGAAFVTATAGGNVTLTGATLVTATAGTGATLAGSTQFGGVVNVGEAKVLIRNVGGNVTVNNVTAKAAIGVGDAELEIDAVQGSVRLLGVHNISAGNGQGADADLQVRNVVGNFTYSGTANISAGTQGSGVAGGLPAGRYQTQFEAIRIGGNVFISGGGINVSGGANNAAGGGSSVEVNLDSIGGSLNINAPLNIVSGINRDAELDIDRIGGVLNVTGSIVSGTAGFTFSRAVTTASCAGIGCGDVNITNQVNISVNTTAGANSNTDAAVYIDEVFGNLTLGLFAPITLTAGQGANADATFDIGGGVIGAGTQGVRGNVTIDGDMLFTANAGSARDASINFDFIGGNVSIGGNMTFNAGDDARVVLRQVGGVVNITGNSLFTAGAGSTAEAVYDIKRVSGSVILGGTKTLIAGNNATAGIQVRDIGGDLIINSGVNAQVGARTAAVGAVSEINTSRIAGNVFLSGQTLLTSGANGAPLISISGVGGVLTAPANAYDDTVGAYTFVNGGCVGCGDISLNGSIGSAGSLQNAVTTLSALNRVNINGDIYLANADLTLAADTDGDGLGDVNVGGIIGVTKTVSTQGNLNVSGNSFNVTGAAVTSGSVADSRVNVLANNINVTLSGGMNVVGGKYIPISFVGTGAVLLDTSVKANNNLTIDAASLTVSGGSANASPMSSIGSGVPVFNLTVDANANLDAGANVTLNLTGTLNVSGGVASASSNTIGSGATTLTAVANANATLLAGGNLNITANAVNLSRGTETQTPTFGGVAVASATSNTQGNNITLNVTTSMNANSAAVTAANDVNITAGTYLENINNSIVAGNNLSVAAGGNYAVNGLYSAGANLSLSAGATLDLNTALSSAASPLNISVALNAGDHLRINNSIYLANQSLTLAADTNANGSGDVNIVGSAGSPVNVSTQGDMAVTGVGFNVADASVTAGTLKAEMNGTIEGLNASFDVGALYMAAAGDINLTTSTINVGSGTVTGISGDALALSVLADNGITLPTTANPNAKFSAGGTLSLGTITMLGDVPYLWLEADATNLQGLTLPEASDVVVQFSPFTVTKSIGVEDVPDASQLVNYNNLQHFGILPGTTIIIGSSLQTGNINIGDLGDVNIGAKNIVFISSANINSTANVISSGVVAELRASQFNGQLIVDEEGNEYVAPVLTEVDVGQVPPEDPIKEKEKNKNLVKDDEDEILLCEAG